MRFSTFISLLLLSNFCNFILAIKLNQRQYCDPLKFYKSSSRLQGTFVPVFTPFDNDGNLDTSPVEQYVKYLFINGITGFVVNDAEAGGALTLKEKKDNLNAWYKYGKKYNMTMIADVGEDLTYKNIKDLAAFASKKGYDAVLYNSISFYNLNSIDLQVKYLADLASVTYPVPIIYHYVPEAGDNLNMVEFVTMAKNTIPGFGGLKANFETIVKVQAVISIDESITFLSSSNYIEVAPYLSRLNGTSTLQANIFPAKTVQIKESVARGDYLTAVERQKEINHAIGACLSVLNVEIITREVYLYVSRLLREAFKLVSGINVGVPPLSLPLISKELVKQCAEKLKSEDVQLASN